ncbi:MAG: outer membrane lipoprotein carrier protein LolA [Treponema sp.]|nr:outer membrane lipoprotein carrier protein LolA [Treponema sp.]
MIGGIKARPFGAFFLLLLFHAASCLAPCAAAPGPSLDSVCRELTAYKVTSGSFVQERTSANLRRPLRSQGSFVICDEGIAWKTEKPVASLLAVSRDKIIQAAPDGRKTVIDGSGNETFKHIAGTLATVFSGDRTELEKNFRVSFSAGGSSPDGNDWVIRLVPKDSTIAAAMRSIVMEGASGKESFISSVLIEEQGGAGIRYVFSDQVHRAGLTDDEKAYFSAE